MQEGGGPRPFDVTTRLLIESDPEGWLAWIGLPVDGPVQPVDSDVGTVLAEVDKVLRVDGPIPWMAHLELQANRDPRLPARMLQYNALLLHRHQLVVESTVILLRPEADDPALKGLFEQHSPTGFRTVSFGYHVVRLWEQPVESLLSGSLSILPMAPIAAVAEDQLPAVLRRVEERVRREAEPTAADELWSATYLLLGLRYDDRTIREVVRSMNWLQESSTYQAILAEGRAEGVAQGVAEGRIDQTHRLVLELGAEKFGTPDPETRSTLDAIDDLDLLEQLARRVLTAGTWSELLSVARDR